MRYSLRKKRFKNPIDNYLLGITFSTAKCLLKKISIFTNTKNSKTIKFKGFDSDTSMVLPLK
jgi:hypothetical protein